MKPGLRSSGGVLVFYKNKLHKGISVQQSRGDRGTVAHGAQ